MAMTINTNVVSINAQRNLSLSGSSLGTSMQRLSSGLRVNSAKDDAAGLAISERMRAQSAGLTVAARNANDGISLAQTTEGALGKIGDMLQRQRELAVQASNATNSTTDREALQAELSQLTAEIDRVAKTTSFNGTKVLDGTFSGGVFQVGASAGDNITIKGTTKATADGLGYVTFGTTTSKSIQADAIQGTDKALENLSITVGDKTTKLNNLTPAASGQERLGQVVAAINEKTADTGVTAFLANDDKGGYTITLKSEAGQPVSLSGLESLAGGVAQDSVSAMDMTALNSMVDGFKPGSDSFNAAGANAIINELGAQLQNATGYNGGQIEAGSVAEDMNNKLTSLKGMVNDSSAFANNATTDSAYTAANFQAALPAISGGTTSTAKWEAADNAALNPELNAGQQAALGKAEDVVMKLNSASSAADVKKALEELDSARTGPGLTSLSHTTLDEEADPATVKDVVAQIQAEIDTLGLRISGGEVTAHRGIDSVDISSQAGAWEALKKIDSAVDQVNAARANLGALQTRFEKSIENIDIQNENISAARGRIVDADFATETANLSRSQILQQAGTAMVAQANQLSQGVLSLLQ